MPFTDSTFRCKSSRKKGFKKSDPVCIDLTQDTDPVCIDLTQDPDPIYIDLTVE